MNQPICPDHGPIDGLGKCWADGCTYDARKKKPKGPAPTDDCDRPAPQYAAFTLPWSAVMSKNKKRGAKPWLNSKEYREKKKEMARRFAMDYSYAPYDVPVAVSLRLFPPNQRGDGPNVQEAIYDCLQDAKVIENDRLIEQWSGVVVGVDKDEPRCEVEVRRAA